MGARETALRVLAACRNNNAWADAALKAQLNRDGLVGADAALCSRMVYGVMQNQLLLDFYLAAYCSQKPDHLQQPLTEILRLGAYQILFLDRVPDSAAVNTSVELAKLSGRGQAAGLVNAVLRKVSQNKENLPEIPQRDEVKYFSIRYSHPKWLVKRLLLLLGRTETEALLALDNGTPPLTVQINPLKTTAEELTRELSGMGRYGEAPRMGPWLSGTDRASATSQRWSPSGRESCWCRTRRPVCIPDRRRAAGAAGTGCLRRPRAASPSAPRFAMAIKAELFPVMYMGAS